MGRGLFSPEILHWQRDSKGAVSGIRCMVFVEFRDAGVDCSACNISLFVFPTGNTALKVLMVFELLEIMIYEKIQCSN